MRCAADRSLLPNDFDAGQYEHLNIDLTGMHDEALADHYVRHGKNEGRSYRDKHFDASFFVGQYRDYAKDVRQQKNDYFEALLPPPPTGVISLVVVDHDSSLAGASLFVAMLLRTVGGPNAVLLTPGNLQAKAANLCPHHHRVFDYLGDATLLCMMLKRLVPRTSLLFNSSNHAMLHAARHFPDAVLHSHEVMDHYLPWIKLATPPHFVVTQRIAEAYAAAAATASDATTAVAVFPLPRIQPPFVDETRRAELLQARTQASSSESRSSSGRTVVAMCGGLHWRKQPTLFAQAAQISKFEGLPLDFIWVGGTREEAHQVFGDKATALVTHISETPDPWHLLARLSDVFVLSSSFDPCPYVVLEALFIGMPTATFHDAIYVHHPPLSGQHLLMPGTPTPTAIIDAALQLAAVVVRTGERFFTHGQDYVLQNYAQPTSSYIEALCQTIDKTLPT